MTDITESRGKVRCKECKYWDEFSPGNGSGYCRIRAANVGIDSWPISGSTDWCGEWEDKSRPLPQKTGRYG